MYRRFVTALIVCGSSWFCCGLTGCGTDAIAVDTCLKIERARCRAADACGAADGSACERAIEVQCLHGFAKSAQPTEKQATQCEDALGQVAECVADRGQNVTPDTCQLDLGGTSPPAKACGLVDSPEELRACRFLKSADESEDEDNEEEDSNEDVETPADASASGDAHSSSMTDPGAADANP